MVNLIKCAGGALVDAASGIFLDRVSSHSGNSPDVGVASLVFDLKINDRKHSQQRFKC
jgi:hypothetical protein